MTLTEPWSKKHKRVNHAASGGQPFNLSNSYAQTLTNPELIALTLARGDNALVNEFYNHSLRYTSQGGSIDLRKEISNLYGPNISEGNIVVFPGAQVALQTAAFALTNSKTHSIVFTPSYQSCQETPLHAGSQLTRIHLYAKNNWEIDMKEVIL